MSGKVSQIEETSADCWKTCEQICTFFREIVSSMFLLRQKITQQQSYRDVAPRVWDHGPLNTINLMMRNAWSVAKTAVKRTCLMQSAFPWVGQAQFVSIYTFYLLAKEIWRTLWWNIWGNELERLPPEIGLLPNLKVLFSYCNCLKVKNSRCSALPTTSWQVSQAAWSPCTSWPS